MDRIGAGILVVVAIMAMNGLAIREAVAADPRPNKVVSERAGDTREIVETTRGSRILALLVALEALQPAR